MISDPEFYFSDFYLWRRKSYYPRSLRIARRRYVRVQWLTVQNVYKENVVRTHRANQNQNKTDEETPM